MAKGRGRARIVSITVRVRASSGREVDLRIDPRKYDAVFVSPEAVENIAVPFYTARRGLAFALRLSERAEQAKRTQGVVVFVHSLYCDPGFKGVP